MTGRTKKMLVVRYGLVAEFVNGTEGFGTFEAKEEALERASQLNLPHDDFVRFRVDEYYYVRNEGQEL